MNNLKCYLSKLTPLWLVLLLFAATWTISSPVLSNKDAVFAFNDGAIETQLTEGARPPSVFFGHWNNKFFFGQGLRTASLNTVLFFEWMLGPHQYRRLGVILAICFTGLAAYIACLLFGRSRSASFLAGIGAGLCGWTVTFPMAGLTARSWLLSWLFLSVGLIHFGQRRGKILPYILAGGFLGMAITDSPDVGVWAATCCAAFFLLSHFSSKRDFARSSILRTGFCFMIYVGASVLLASNTVINMYELYAKPSTARLTAESPPGDGQKTYAWATQWSLPANETWSLIACDYHGASSRSQEDPYWGRMGRTDGWEKHKQGFRNFRLAGYALGTVPVILLMFGWLLLRDQSKKERILFYIINVLTVCCLALSWGKYFPLYRIVYSLPLLGSIRNPEKWMCGFFVFVIIAVAWSFDAIRSYVLKTEERRKTPTLWLIAGVLPILVLLNLIGLFSNSSFSKHLQADGFGPTVNTIFANSLGVLITALLCSIIAGSAIAFLLTRKKKGWIPALTGILVVLSMFELSQAAKPYVMPHHYRHLLEPNELMTLLKKDYPNNRIKVIPTQDNILNNFRLTWLRAQDISLFDPVSVRNMPPDYTMLFDELQNDPFTLWKLGAIRYFICSPQVAQQLLSSPAHFAQKALFTFTQSANGAIHPRIIATPPPNNFYYMVLEYKDALPYSRFSHSVRAVLPGDEGRKKSFESMKQTNAIWTDYIACSDIEAVQLADDFEGRISVIRKTPAEVSMETESTEDSFLIVAEHYDPDWIAEIDGNSTPVFCADGILQSIRVPKGKHSVSLRYRPPKYALAISGAGFATQAVLLLLFGISFLKRPEHEGEGIDT